MSYPTESQLRSWNNDGMDPYWKPSFSEPEKPKPALLEVANKLADALKSASHTEHSPGFCKICDALTEWNTFRGEK